MGITVRHRRALTVPDSSRPNVVQPSNWNDTHNIELTGKLAALDAAAGIWDDLLGGASAAAILTLLGGVGTNSPAFTGTPTAPTAAPGTNTTQLATTAFVVAAVAQLLGSAPGALDTLDELAAALGDDANFAATITNALALKAALASPAFTGNPTAPTVAGSADTSTSIATTAFVQAVKATIAQFLIASQPEAEGLTDNTKGMTPLRTAQAIAAYLAANPVGGVPSGTVSFTLLNAAPSGWLLFNDQTIGNTGSGAGFANPAAQAIFTAMYDNFVDADCAILTGAGAATTRAAQTNAATAWANLCRINLPKTLGRALAVAGSGAGLTSRARGSIAGAESKALVAGENGPHAHTVTRNDTAGGTIAAVMPATGNPVSDIGTSSSGSGAAFSLIDPRVHLNAMVKL